jgi:hypothetical protein
VPPELMEAVPYVLLGFYLGWTPEQIDKMPLSFVNKALVLVEHLVKGTEGEGGLGAMSRKFLKELSSLRM